MLFSIALAGAVGMVLLVMVTTGDIKQVKNEQGPSKKVSQRFVC